ADQPRDLFAIFQCRHQLAIVIVEHLAMSPEQLVGTLHFRQTPSRQRTASHGEMADVAVGHRHQLDMMSQCRPLGGGAADLDLAIVRMGRERDDGGLAVIRWNGRLRFRLIGGFRGKFTAKETERKTASEKACRAYESSGIPHEKAPE